MAKRERIRIEREVLHEQVWNKSMVQLAKDYGISDVGLRKICKRLNVPTPPQGYWARKYRKGPPQLPPTQGHTFHNLIIDTSDPEPPQKPEYLDPRSAKMIVFEQKPLKPPSDRDLKNSFARKGGASNVKTNTLVNARKIKRKLSRKS